MNKRKQPRENTIEVPDMDVEVPTTFERSDIAERFGDVPDSFDVHRVFIDDDYLVRAESHRQDGDVIECVYKTEPGTSGGWLTGKTGWIASRIEDPIEAEIGVTVWERDE